MPLMESSCSHIVSLLPLRLVFRGTSIAVSVMQFDTVEFIDEIIPKSFPVLHGRAFGVLRSAAAPDADGVCNPSRLRRCQQHGIPDSRHVKSGQQQVVPHVENTRPEFFLFPDSPVIYLMTFIPRETDCVFAIMITLSCLPRFLFRRVLRFPIPRCPTPLICVPPTCPVP